MSGARASGGQVQAGGLYQINERGPELLDVDGKQLLMMARNASMVTANDCIGGGGRMPSVTNNFSIQGAVDRRTQSQVGAEAYRGSRQAFYRVS